MRKLFLLLVLLPLRVFAAAQCTQYASVDYPVIPWSSTYQAACSAIVAHVNGLFSAANSPTGSMQSCTSSQVTMLRVGVIYTFGITSRVTTDCDDICSTNAGKSEIINVTSGWKRTPKVNDASEEWVYTYRLPASGVATVCGGAAVCEMTIDASEPCADCGAYVSQVPAANGLHRVSTDFRGHFTGKTCSAASTSDLPPEAMQRDNSKDPPCPGYVGEVNGVRGCYGTAAKPITPVPPVEKPAGHGPGDAGNPAAGSKPSSGEGSGSGGSGRTPSTGSGGSGGGPAGAAAGSGTKPDGTAPKPGEGKEQANCGAPGQPKCGIDEGGTPSKFDGDKAALDGWKSAVEANRNTIKDADGSFFDSYRMFFAVPPIVPCEPIELPNEQVLTRQCDVVEGTRSVMSYIWALAAIWICLGWIREAI